MAQESKKVVIVNGSSRILGLLETTLGGGRYDLVFVEYYGHAYSQIKRVQPNLVILVMDLDDPSGFQVLSMLKLDSETREIPILTYTSQDEDDEDEIDLDEPVPDAEALEAFFRNNN